MNKKQVPIEIRMYGNFQLPLDPLEIVTMEEYELSLALHRTLFTYDQARRVKPGVISSWNFNRKKGEYLFVLDQRAKWSSGVNIRAEDVVANLKRAVRRKSKFGQMITSLIDVKKVRSDQGQIFIPTLQGEPSEELFHRLGAQSFALLHPSEWDCGDEVISNLISSGPYALVPGGEDEIRLENNVFDFMRPSRGPKVVLLRPPTGRDDLEEFIAGKSWANLQRASSLLGKTEYELIKKRGFNVWSRSLDRLSILRVNSHSAQKKKLRELVKLFTANWQNKTDFDLPISAVVAKSLQPQGYPLFHEVLTAPSPKVKAPIREVRIINAGGLIAKFLLPAIEETMNSMGVKVKWQTKSKANYLKIISGKSGSYDLALVNWGAADPDPSAWMSFIMGENTPFLDIEAADRKKYFSAIKQKGKAKAIAMFKELLQAMQERGSICPILHYASMFLADSEISFSRIDPLDETIDFSKLRRMRMRRGHRC